MADRNMIRRPIKNTMEDNVNAIDRTNEDIHRHIIQNKFEIFSTFMFMTWRCWSISV